VTDEPLVFLERFAYVPGMGTFGVLSIPDVGFQCYSVEQDWENNLPRLSCIPEGLYRITLGRYNRGGYPAYVLHDVPGRTHIKIHRGNTLDDLMGCIAPGKELGVLHDQWAVLKSTQAYAEFMEALKGVDETSIKVSSVFHVGRTGVAT
jgi:hypothetical protein